MNEPKNPLLEPAKLSFKTLHQTMFETDADMSKEAPQEQIDISKVLEDGDKSQKREAQALSRSQKLRKSSEFIPESAMKVRKAYFCNEQNGFFMRDVQA